VPEPTTRRCRRLVAATVVVGTVIAGTGCGDEAGDDGLADRRAEVAERGSEVMPFDLDATTHRFEPTDSGLVETVVADDPGDAENVALIREHLGHETERFRGGDYSDPAAIHGDDMPGLADLEAGASRIDVTYADEPTGGRISYTTTDPALVVALHDWSSAQTMDHGTHADAAGHDPMGR
jgi:hypothetical protein